MPVKEKTTNKSESVDAIGNMLKTFGDTLSEIMDDPKLREKAREFYKSVVDAAAKFASTKIKDDDARAKLVDVGKAAQSLGNSMVQEFGIGKRENSKIISD